MTLNRMKLTVGKYYSVVQRVTEGPAYDSLRAFKFIFRYVLCSTFWQTK